MLPRNAIRSSSLTAAAALLLPLLPSAAFGFSLPSPRRSPLPNVVVGVDRRSPLRTASDVSASALAALSLSDGDDDDCDRGFLSEGGISFGGRRPFLSAVAAASASVLLPSHPAGAEEDFASIAARASKLAVDVETAEQRQQSAQQKSSIPEASSSAAAKKIDADVRTIYDFDLPVAGKSTPVAELIGQEFRSVDDAAGGEGEGKKERTVGEKVKAILIVNIKQDDPIARRNIPELISLASQYGRNGEFVVICSPTDQGYYEPDTSALIRLKLASEYGYGINPSTILTDKVNLLMTGAHPFWRWLENGCRTPMGLGRIQGNFEKFLVDGRTGLPLRRYPRKYNPRNVRDDLEALLAGKPLPPPGYDYLEEWRSASKDAETDTYRFQKGLNVFDQ